MPNYLQIYIYNESSSDMFPLLLRICEFALKSEVMAMVPANGISFPFSPEKKTRQKSALKLSMMKAIES